MEKKSYEIVRELLIYVIFIIIVLIMAYGGRDATTFQYTNELRHTFLGFSEEEDIKYAFDKVGLPHFLLKCCFQYPSIANKKMRENFMVLFR